MEMKEVPRPKKVQTYHEVKTQRKLFVASFLALPILSFFVFFVYTNIDGVLMAFKHEVTVDGVLKEEWSLDNWRWIFTNQSERAHILLALRNTLLFFLSGLFISFPVGLFMAYFFFKQIKGYKVFRFIFYLPCVISSSVLVVLFKVTIGVGGPWRALVEAFGGIYKIPLNNEPNALIAILIYSISFSFGGRLIVLCGSMNGLNREVMEAGAIDGCNWFQEFTLLVVPMLWPTLSTMITLEAAGFLSVSGPILAFTEGAYGTTALSFIMYDLVVGLTRGQNLYQASALGLLMTAVTFPIVMLIWKTTSRGTED